MKLSILLFLFSLSITMLTVAQNNQVELRLGYQRTWMVDQQASPLKYQSNEKNVNLSFVHNGRRSRYSLTLGGSAGDFFATGFKSRQLYDPGYNGDGSPKRDSFPLAGQLYNGRIQAGYFLKMAGRNRGIAGRSVHIDSYVGCSVADQLFYTDNFVRTGWLNSTALNSAFQLIASVNEKHHISFGLNLPLIAVNSRLPYHNTISSAAGASDLKAFFQQGTRFAWVADFQNPQFDAAYAFSLSKKFRLGLHYFGQWLRYSKELPIALIQNNLSLTASF